MLLMIDNYDSFTYNLVQYFGELKTPLRVVRNDQLSLEQIRRLRPRQIVISPGPGRPEDAGISVALIQAFLNTIPILGVCLGHQCLAYALGGRIVQARRLMHGKTSQISHNGKTLFQGIKNPFEATRYHSLVIDRRTLPKELEIIARTKDRDREIMAVRHKRYPVWGVQFHPESILTGEGIKILSNFLNLTWKRSSKN